jgi:hypothetical protein
MVAEMQPKSRTGSTVRGTEVVHIKALIELDEKSFLLDFVSRIVKGNNTD